MQSEVIIPENLPNHIGLILDGNRRWAKENGFDNTLQGHKKGYDNLKGLAEYAFDRGIKTVSAYVFSTENWGRSKTEVDYLMKLLLRMMKRDIKELHRKGVKVLWLGTKVGLSPEIIAVQLHGQFLWRRPLLKQFFLMKYP